MGKCLGNDIEVDTMKCKNKILKLIHKNVSYKSKEAIFKLFNLYTGLCLELNLGMIFLYRLHYREDINFLREGRDVMRV